MKTLVYGSIFLCCLVAFSSCGYTALEAPSKKAEKEAPEPLPDLLITAIDRSVHVEEMVMDGDPYAVTTFAIRVTNQGSAPFAGRLGIAWTDTEEGVKYRHFQHLEYAKYAVLKRGGSIGIPISVSYVVYPPGRRLLFMVVTDVFREGMTGPFYKFGTTPYRELNMENNFTEYTVE